MSISPCRQLEGNPVIGAYDGVALKLTAWADAHKDLIANNDELRTAVQDAQQKIRGEIE